MKALSLFNGISGLHLALDKSGIELDETYFNIAKERIEDAQIKLDGGM